MNNSNAVLPPPDLVTLAERYPSLLITPFKTRAAYASLVAGLLALLVFGAWWLDLSFDRILSGISQLGRFAVLMFPPTPGNSFFTYLNALGETLAIALLGTLTAALLAFPLGILAASNVIPSRGFRFVLRRVLDTLRSVDTLVWALIWINVVGLGPFAGVLAIASSDLGAFGKLFSETLEGASGKGAEGVRSAVAHACTNYDSAC